MKLYIRWITITLAAFLLGACGMFVRSPGFGLGSKLGLLEGSPNAANGKQIYFTAVSARGTRISFRGGPSFGGMMMGSYLTCASCHGSDAGGGTHVMHMQVMDAPDITYAALRGEADEHGGEEHGDEHEGYSMEDFRRAVIEGKHPDGESLNRDMPRWQMSDEDLTDLLEYLKTLSD